MTAPATDIEGALRILLRGAAGVYTEADLRDRLARAQREGRPLRVKLGVDPSAPDLHLGHTVVLRKLRQFQDLGHQAIFLIGDFTARIGDPTGRSRTRPALSEEEIERNAATYLEQVGRILDVPRLEIRRNSEWLAPMLLDEFYRLAAASTAAKFLQREDFARRIREGVPLHLHELLYPLLQAYDSVALRADVELGGVDQTLNILVGRDLQRELGQDPQIGLVLPILPGIGGGEKMSKSLGNAVGITEPPEEMFAKIMSIPDDLMREYFVLLTDVPEEEVERLLVGHPKEAKKRLADEIVAGYYPGHRAREHWERLFEKHDVPEEIAELFCEAEIGALDLVSRTGLFASRSEARRVIEQGGVALDGTRICDPRAVLSLRTGQILRVGKKRRFFRITVR